MKIASKRAYHGRNNGIQELNNSDLSPQAAPDRAHLQANVPSTNDCQLLWYRLQEQGAC